MHGLTTSNLSSVASDVQSLFQYQDVSG